MMEIRPWHWLVALLLATTIHLAFALNIERPAKPELIGPGIEIRLGASDDGNGETHELRPMGTATLEALGPTTDTVTEERVDAQDVVNSEPEVFEAVPAEALSPALDPEAVLLPIATTPAPAVQAKTLPKPEIKRIASKKKKKIDKRAKTKSASKQRKSRRSKTKKDAAESTLAGKKEIGRKNGQGQGKGGSDGKGAGGGKAARSNYAGALAAWLNKHKRYPKRARKLEQQGTTKVRFTIDKRGNLLSFRILKSAGHDLLDKEVRAMLRRASPMPAIPKAIARAELTVTVPISFSLR